jgi:hypothetical protein
LPYAIGRTRPSATDAGHCAICSSLAERVEILEKKQCYLELSSAQDGTSQERRSKLWLVCSWRLPSGVAEASDLGYAMFG